jgi:hypothetical protein
MTRRYLPVHVPGALLSLGDAHAMQGVHHRADRLHRGPLGLGSGVQARQSGSGSSRNVLFVRRPESTWLRKYPVGEFFVPQEQIRTASTPRPAATTNAGAGALNTRIAGYVPGRPERTLAPGYGMLIPEGSDLVFQLHYTANGKVATDRSRAGFVFAKTSPEKRVFSFSAFNDAFAIPPGASNYAVSGAGVLGVDGELIEVYPNIQLRGKSMALTAVYPTGQREELLRVPSYDFNWQLLYQLSESKKLPKGTRLIADEAFDNSPSNRYNPTQRPRFGGKTKAGTR